MKVWVVVVEWDRIIDEIFDVCASKESADAAVVSANAARKGLNEPTAVRVEEWTVKP